MFGKPKLLLLSALLFLLLLALPAIATVLYVEGREGTDNMADGYNVLRISSTMIEYDVITATGFAVIAKGTPATISTDSTPYVAKGSGSLWRRGKGTRTCKLVFTIDPNTFLYHVTAKTSTGVVLYDKTGTLDAFPVSSIYPLPATEPRE